MTVTAIETEEFKMTEIGPLPIKWGVAKFGELVAEITTGDWGETNPGNDLQKCYVLRGTDFSRVIKGSFANIPIRYLRPSSLQKRRLCKGAILIELSGGSKDQPTGRVAMVTGELIGRSTLPLVFSNFVKRLSVKSSLLPEFCGHYWEFLYQSGVTRTYEKRTTGIRNFKLDDFLASEYIPLPPLPEQKKIAYVLSSVQAAIEKTEAVIKGTRELKKSLMRHLFTYGPVPVSEAEQVPLKETEIGIVPEGWEVVRFDKIIRSGPQNGIYKHQSYYGDGTSIVRIDDYGNEGDVVSRATSKVRLTPEEVEKYRLNRNDILINRVNSLTHLGKAALVGTLTEPVVFESNMMRLIVDQSLGTPEYTLRFLSLPFTRDQMRGKAKRAVAQSSINQGDVRSLVFALPLLAIQRKITVILTVVDNKIHVEENKKKALEALFKTLVSNLMTGKIRVNNLEAPV